MNFSQNILLVPFFFVRAKGIRLRGLLFSLKYMTWKTTMPSFISGWFRNFGARGLLADAACSWLACQVRKPTPLTLSVTETWLGTGYFGPVALNVLCIRCIVVWRVVSFSVFCSVLHWMNDRLGVQLLHLHVDSAGLPNPCSWHGACRKSENGKA